LEHRDWRLADRRRPPLCPHRDRRAGQHLSESPPTIGRATRSGSTCEAGPKVVRTSRSCVAGCVRSLIRCQGRRQDYTVPRLGPKMCSMPDHSGPGATGRRSESPAFAGL
jgi:hypothetical protein